MHNASSPVRLAYYSTIPCEPTFGGPLQIYRHFRERSDFEFIDLNPAETPPWDGWLPRRIVESRLFQRVCNTRLFPWIIYGSNHTLLGGQARQLARRIRESQADALVTVAYGRRCYVACLAARLSKVPLITFYHDWWPDLVLAKTLRTHAWMDRKFRRLALKSDLILPVTQALLDELGGHRNAAILPPIPATRSQTESVDAPTQNEEPNRRRLLVYAGTLEGPYGTMVRELADALHRQPECGWNIRAYGPATSWPTEERERLADLGIYGGFLAQGPELEAALQEADALLVVMDFLPENRRRVRTSFPSKIIDYLAYRNPIIAWGPEDCFAVKLIRQSALGVFITTPSASKASSRLSASDLDACIKASQAGNSESFLMEYRPEKLQLKLVDSLACLIAQY